MTKFSRMTLRSIALLLVILFGAGPFSAIAWAEPVESRVLSLSETNREVALAKLESELREDLRKQDKAQVIVYLKEQLDSAALAKTARKELAKRLTPYALDLAVARRVVEGLRAKADENQAGLLDYLAREQAKGTVSSYRSFYVANALYVEADEAVIENVAYRSEVEAIYKNKTRKLLEPLASSGAKPSGAQLEWNIERVKADQAWGLGVDGTGVVVANMDTGVDWEHPALKGKWRGYDPKTGEPQPDGNWFDAVVGEKLPADPNGHGTHVMGTMVGQEPDGSNQIGVAPGAQWIAARILDRDGYGTDIDILEAAEWIIAPGGNADLAPDVVNNSWGGGPGMDDWFRAAVSNWRAAGIFPVFAAGNQQPWDPPPTPGSIANPANYPEAFAVAATDSNDVRASFSLLGPSPYDESLIKPEISAPGVDIRSSVPGGGYEGGWSGTSMAAPHIAGVAALLKSANQSLTIDDIATIIEETARPLTDADYPDAPNFGYGYGLVDALEAVAIVSGGSGIVKGKVLVEGQDLALPVIVHEQTVTEAFAGSAIDILAEVSDDVSVTSAELLVNPKGESFWIVAPMKRVKGDHRLGTWKGTITSDMFLKDGVSYKIKATDFDGNEVVSEEFRIDLVFGILPDKYSQGFEQNTLGWTMNGDWQWGSASGIDPIPYEGTKFLGTRLGTYHSETTDSWLVSPPIDLRDASLEEVTLRLHNWLGTADRKAYGRILVTNDYGATFTQVGPDYSGFSNGWKELAVNLADWVGSPEPVFVAFNFVSDTYMTGEGWYIDNVRLVGLDETAPAVPQDLMAQSDLKGINLSWTAPPDGDVVTFRIFRSAQAGGPYTYLADAPASPFIDKTAPFNEEQYYVISAVDISGNESAQSPEAAGTARPYTALYGADFEAEDGGFVPGTLYGEVNDWQWGIPTSGPMAAASGEKLWATKLAGNYSDNSAAYIESPAIAIPEGSQAVLTFNHWFDFDSTYDVFWDAGEIQLSNDDGKNWNNITPTPFGQYGGHVKEWLKEEISLAQYDGQTVKLRFYFYSDDRATFPGWYVDDVYVMGLTQNPVRPDAVASKLPTNKTIQAKSPLRNYREQEIQASDFDKTLSAAEVEAIAMAGGGIPAQGASVTVKETGRAVKTDPATGSFSLRLALGEYTLVAEAYGYLPKEATVKVEEDKLSNVTFFLDPRPRGSISGRVFDRYYGNPAAFAEVRLLEDPNVPAVTADEEGKFTMPSVIVGDYTLKASAKGFESAEFPVAVRDGEVTEVELGLKRFVGYAGEIIYDDGTAEDAIVLNQKPNGLAVRFTPEQFGKVKGLNVYLWDESFPSPGGNRLGFLIYGVDEGGKPYPVGEPLFVDNLVRGGWNYIDLSGFAYSTDRDFYISTIQDRDGYGVPAVGMDMASPYGDRSYLNIGGDFLPLAEQGFPGSLMMRAVFSNSVSTPVFTNLEQTNYSNQDSILVEGSVDTDGIVKLYLNGELNQTVLSVGRKFSVEIPLPLEVNLIRATAELDGVETEPSLEVTVIKDQKAPALEVFTPEDGAQLNVELIHVTGNVLDEYLDEVMVNGKTVVREENGDFKEKVILEEGENVIKVEALDLAGNRVTEERRVTVSLSDLSISRMEPYWDVEAQAGEAVEVSFYSNTEGAQAFYNISLPIGAQSIAQTPMKEVSPGFYQAFWTVPDNVKFRDARVNFELKDAFGNRTSAVAPGTLSIGITPEAERVAGTSRFITAVKASQRAFAWADTVILVSGRNFPDAMAGAPLAKIYDAPILLTERTYVPQAVLNEITRLGAAKIILLGGESVIAPEVVHQLADYEVERIAGISRFATAVNIGEQVVKASNSNRAFLVNGYNFPDGLSVGPAAALSGSPILFGGTDSLPKATLDALEAWGIENITIVGGTNAISDAVKNELTTAGYVVTRIQGATRYATALKVAEELFASPKYVVIASGENFPDALAGGPLAAKLGAPVLLVNKDSVSQGVLDYLKAKGVKKVLLLGGNLVISDAVAEAIKNAIN